MGNLSVFALGSARSETGMRIVSDWLVKARGVGVGDGDADGDAEALDVGLGAEDASALTVGSGDAVGVEVSD